MLYLNTMYSLVHEIANQDGNHDITDKYTATFYHKVLWSDNVSYHLLSTVETIKIRKVLWALWGFFNMGHLKTKSQNRPVERDLTIKYHSGEIGDWFRPISHTNIDIKIPSF